MQKLKIFNETHIENKTNKFLKYFIGTNFSVFHLNIALFVLKISSLISIEIEKIGRARISAFLHFAGQFWLKSKNRISIF